MSYATTVLADSPLIYWKLDEPGGPSMADASGNGRGGTAAATGIIYSAAAVPPYGSRAAVTFDGVTGIITQTASINLGVYSAVTIEFWMNIPAFANDDRGPVSFPNAGPNTAGGFAIFPNWGGGSWLTQAHATGNFTTLIHTRPSPGVPHYYAFVLKQNSTGAGTMAAYLDGAVWTPSSTDFSGTSDTFATANFLLGQAVDGRINATMDEFAVYGSDIGATRVAAHYNAGITQPFPQAQPMLHALGSFGT